MNKKGFTLIEILVTISLLGLVALIGVSLAKNISGKINDKLFKAKVKQIEKAALNALEDNTVNIQEKIMFKGSANAEPVSASGYYYVISAVAAGYLEPDEKAKEPYHIINPKNNKPMDQCVIKVEITEKGRPKVDFVEGAVGAYSAAAANEYYSIYSCE